MFWLNFLFKVESSDFAELQKLIPILREIAESHVEEEITEQANDLMVMILTKTNVLREKINQPSRGTKGKSHDAVDREKHLNIKTSGSDNGQEGESDSDIGKK